MAASSSTSASAVRKREGVAAQQPRCRPADAQRADLRRHALAVRLPQRRGGRIVAGRAQPVVERGERAMGQPARLLDAPAFGIAVGQAEAACRRQQRRHQGHGKTRQQGGMEDPPAASPAGRTAPGRERRPPPLWRATAPATVAPTAGRRRPGAGGRQGVGARPAVAAVGRLLLIPAPLAVNAGRATPASVLRQELLDSLAAAG